MDAGNINEIGRLGEAPSAYLFDKFQSCTFPGENISLQSAFLFR